MNLYRMINGVNPAGFFILPMLGYHPDSYPGFRDCFTSDEIRPDLDNKIHIYTQTGGSNREKYRVEIDWMRNLPGYITDFDDASDSAYASFVYEVPDEFSEDFKLIMKHRLKDTSQAYQNKLYEIYGTELRDKLDKIFISESD